jgi:hypothetical protein
MGELEDGGLKMKDGNFRRGTKNERMVTLRLSAGAKPFRRPLPMAAVLVFLLRQIRYSELE